MRQHLYYILLCAATILSMVSCERGEADFGEADSIDSAITYSPKVLNTRAQHTNTATLEVYGKLNIAAFLSDNTKGYYFGNEIKFDGSKWKSGLAHYWPIGNSIDIFAYSPLEDFIIVENYNNYTNYSLRYICPADVNDQVDLLARSLKNQSYKTNNGAVELELDHILSSIKFNVEILGESNVTLGSININYVNIEKERSYNFATESWAPSEEIYFTKADGLSTAINIYKTNTSNTGSVKFTDIEDRIIIIPQSISSSKDDPHYISIQVSYTLNGAQDQNKVLVHTGVMPLPVPGNKYEAGKDYEYNVVINDELILFEDLSIEDQNDPTPAYGNIDLGLITTLKTASEIGYTGTDETSAEYYYTTAERVKNLLLDGVRDFVVVGSMGARNKSNSNTLGNGKLGYYGEGSSPFIIGANMVELGSEDYFSVDLRGTYDYPRFGDVKADNDAGDATFDNVIGDDEPVFIAGLFAHIDHLDEVMFPHGLAAIGDHSFADCDALRYIDISEVKHIEEGAFQHCSQLTVVDNGQLTRIHENGFDSCTSLTTIDLSQVVEVDELGFVNCTSLTNVNLSELNKIGKHAFNGCSNLTLKIGTSIPGFTMVEDFAFSGCYRLGENGAKIDLISATKVGMHAFKDCQHIQLSSENLNLITEVGEYGLHGCTMLGLGQELKMPLLSTIGESAFASSPEVNIVEGLDNLTIIPELAFQNCTALTGYSASAPAEERVLSLKSVTRVESYGLFNTAITNIAFSDSKLTTIGAQAFNSCKDLTTVSGLNGVTSVGESAFANCSSLELLSLPLLTNDDCGIQFFYGCNSLKTISLPQLTSNYLGSWSDDTGSHDSTVIGMISSEFTNIESINLPALVVDIPAWHFQNKAELNSVNFASATSVGNGAFSGCEVLVELVLTSVKAVGDQAFNDCENLKEIRLPNVNGSFGGWGYFGTNTTLQKVDLSTIDTIIGGTFVDCTNIESIDLRSVTTVGEQIIAACGSLVKLNLSGVVDTELLNEGAFWHFDNSANCELWLSDELAPESGTSFMGMSWKAIHKASDNVEFTL